MLLEGLKDLGLEASRGARRCGRNKDAKGMKLMTNKELRTPSRRFSESAGQYFSHVPTLFARSAKRMGQRSLIWIGQRVALGMLAMGLAAMAWAQGVSTTTVQGTVYLANGQPGAGTLVISWPGFTTAAGQDVAADSMTVTIAPDGFVSVNLAPNQGATPAGEYYTAVYYMSDGTVNTQYWVIPAAANATLAQVQVQVMPAAQAIKAVSKAYVDQAITEMTQSLLTASGGTLSGPLYLNADPTQPLQAATKHYVDTQVATAVPLAGGNMTGALTTPAVNGVEAPTAASGQTTLQTAMNAAGTHGAMEIPPNYAGTDTFTNANGVKVVDWRTSGSQQTERSVKEFGAVCDGVTDDTSALQAALNYANAHGVALVLPEGTCKTRTLSWHGESIGGLGKQVSALMGFPGEDVLVSGPDALNLLSYTRLHDLTIYVDQSVDASCSPAEGRAAAGSCQLSRAIEANSIFSPGGNGLTATAGTGAAWWLGNCAIAMQATTGAGGNGLRVAEMENVEIATTGVDPMATQYPGAHSTHTCGLYLAQWPQWSDFRNIDIRGVNSGVAIPALPVTAPAGLNADSNRWQNVTIQATHAFTAAAGSNNVLDNLVALAGNSTATGEPPTGLVLDLSGNAQGWTVRNAVVMPTWNAVQPALAVTAAGGAVTAVTVGSERGLGWDPYGASVPVAFNGSCTAQATATVNANGSIASVTVTQGGVGCSSTTAASINEPGTWDTAAAVNLIGGQNMTFFAGNLLKGNGGYTVWNAGSSASYGTQVDGGGGTLPGGGTYAALVGSSRVGAAFQVDQFPGADIGAKIQACVNALNASYGGTCDARNFTGNLSMASNLTIATPNTAVLLPCATIATANQIVVTAGTRNVSLRGCALRGGTASSGSQGGTVFAYSGNGAMVVVGDPTYAVDTPGFHIDDVAINTTAATSATAQGLVAYRTQEMDLESLYFLGNANQTGMTLDGTGNYTGGTFLDDQLGGFGTAVNAIGHQVTNPATTDWMNASTFVRLHINCPTASGNPISGTYGINLQQGDGNTFTGGDVEGCATALHLGANAQNNTMVGLRNENSTNQIVADAGSQYNNWMTGGTMFTGKLTDNGTRNSFLDTFHRSFNALNGDWYGSQQDATLTNHFRLGIGTGNERGLLNEIQTDYGYRWLYGFGDGTSGQQVYQVQDLLNNVNRLQIQQWNHGQSSTNNQTALNAAGTGNVCFNCSSNAGTGGVSFSSGGATPATEATVDSAGDAQFNGTLQVAGTSQSTGTMTVRNNADAEVDYYLWPGLTTSQKGSYTYKDWNGNSQWYMVKDASNNWALNSAVGGLDSFKAYQSTNSGDTYIDASNATGHIRLNYESGSGAETDIYSGSSANLVAAFLGPTSIKFPGLAASSGHFCLQVDTSGYLTNTGAACGSGSGSGVTSGTINSGSAGQIAYYTASGTTLGGATAVPLASGGTGATSATGAVANLLPGVASDGNNGIIVTGNVKAGKAIPALSPWCDIRSQGAVIDGATPIDSAVQACINIVDSVYGGTGTVLLPCVRAGSTGAGCYLANSSALTGPVAGNVKFLVQGSIQLGSSLVGYGWQNWFGDTSGNYGQFQTGSTPGTFFGPNVTGTLGTAISAPGTSVTVTPTFTSGTIATLPPGSAITIAGLTTSAATATRIYPSTVYGYSEVTVQLASPVRIPPGETFTLSGCSDASFDVTNNAVNASDYTARTLTFFQLSTTPSTATGCTATGFNEDAYESSHIFCSNGVPYSGFTCPSGNTVGSNKITIAVSHAHSASDQFGAVAVGPALNTFGPQTWDSIFITGCSGMCFWADGSTNLVMNHVGASAAGAITSGAIELSGLYLSQLHDVFGQISTFPQGGCGGGVYSNCSQPSYPYALRCDAGAPGLYYSASVSGCLSVDIDQGSVFVGGIKLDGSGYEAVTGLPRLTSTMYEEVWGNAVTIDNRWPIQAGTCLSLKDQYLQDNVTQLAQYLVGYTDGGIQPSGCVQIDNNQPIDTGSLVNQYFNGVLPVQDANGATRAIPLNNTAASGVYNEGNLLAGEIENEGAGFGPQIASYGSLPMASYSVSSWSSLCATAGNCTVHAVVGPDGPNGQAVSAEMDTASVAADIQIGTWTGATYPGDHFIVWAWGRPGSGINQNYVTGFIGTVIGANNAFYIGGPGITFAPTMGNGGWNNVCSPSAFGTGLANNGWSSQVAICTITTGDSTPSAITFHLTASNGATSYVWGNQIAEPGWAFIPGPNNPACTAAGTCTLTADQIEEARRDQYHGFVPPGMSAGTAATGETVSANGYKVNGTPLNAPSETYNASASGSITLPSADRAEATYVLSGNVTASIGVGTGGGKVTIFVCQAASGGPYTWTWPASWKGGVNVGTTAGTCSEQTGTYISGLGDWHGDAGSTNVPQ